MEVKTFLYFCIFILPKTCSTAQFPDTRLQAAFFLYRNRLGCSGLWLDLMRLTWSVNVFLQTFILRNRFHFPALTINHILCIRLFITFDVSSLTGDYDATSEWRYWFKNAEMRRMSGEFGRWIVYMILLPNILSQQHLIRPTNTNVPRHSCLWIEHSPLSFHSNRSGS